MPVLREHLAAFVAAEPEALVFPGQRGQPLRASNFNKMSAWPYAVSAIGAEGLHIHDLRHTVITSRPTAARPARPDNADGP